MKNNELHALAQLAAKNIKTEDNKSGTKTISDPKSPPEDGIFSDAIRKLNKVGQYEVNVLVDGKTFKRKHRQLINLRSPFDIELAANGYNESTQYTVYISPRSKNIDIQKSSIVAKVKAPDGSSIIRTIPYAPEAKRWELPIENTKGDGIYKVALKVKGINSDGNPFKFAPKSFSATFPRDMSDTRQYVSITEDPESVENNELSAEGEVAAAPEQKVEPIAEAAVTAESPATIDSPIEIPETLEQKLLELSNVPFDLAKDYMLRADLVILGESEYVLLMTLHHIAFDGWSWSIFMDEMLRLYSKHLDQNLSDLPALPIQYSDYALWQREHIDGEVLEKK
ncbi:condensation domain-containing protein, partial [uncultured Paraglaciecola sp.]|uniref:condensation domain-containing protein n=1 Tax=uncultured Paraglaciecola sp. TaxID=1765024 RepID=UPI0026177D2E